ncbi:MAG TPA: ThuA domain-containing protein [Stellaceae bacterium]|nr:ThuA domain-containing protein [Stellaceae bacterium]
MAEQHSGRAHVITGGFPPGSMGGHDHDYVRLRLLGLLAERDIPASVANDFTDLEKWLPVSRLLITYVAGPYPDAAQCRALRSWLEAGGNWLGLHGTSGGRAERVEGVRMRRTVTTEHHALLGSRFLTHPPIREFRVDVRDGASPLTRGLGTSFVVEDEPYFVELQDPGATRILLTAEYGAEAASATEGLYPSDTSLQADGKTRVIAYSRGVGSGGVAYCALGHSHNPAIRAGRPANPADPTPPTFRAPWENAGFTTFLRNAIAWGIGA